MKDDLIPVEFAGVGFDVTEHGNGTLVLEFDGQRIPSLPGIDFGLVFNPGTTPQQAEEVRAILEKHCAYMFAGFMNRVEDESFKLMLTELYDDMGYFDPTRPKGPGDELFPQGF